MHSTVINPMNELTAADEVEIRRLLDENGIAEEDIDQHVEEIRNHDPTQECEPCGDGKVQQPIFKNKPPYYILMGEALHRQECDRIIERARGEGWDKGTIIDGTASRNSSVRFLNDDWLLDRMRQMAIFAGPLLGIDVQPELLASVQIGRYLPPNEDYGWHVDHDPSRRHVQHDRKLSLVGALSDGGCLELKDIGRLQLNAGDMLAFGGNVSHMAPPLDYKRYTIVAWIPGPPWK